MAEQPLKEFWYPAEFSSQLDSKTLVPFELFDEPWVLFRWVGKWLGTAGCVTPGVTAWYKQLRRCGRHSSVLDYVTCSSAACTAVV